MCSTVSSATAVRRFTGFGINDTALSDTLTAIDVLPIHYKQMARTALDSMSCAKSKIMHCPAGQT